MMEMTSSRRKELSAQANSIKPVVIIGQSGLTDSVVGKVEESLKAHELIKIKFLEFKDEKKELIEKLCNDCNAVLVRIIGNIAIIYRENPEKEQKK
ncbi:MAG: YhbY family RNA-binding protein [Treponema sp.]